MRIKKVNYYRFKQALKISKIVLTTKFISILLLLHDLFNDYSGLIIIFSNSCFPDADFNHRAKKILPC